MSFNFGNMWSSHKKNNVYKFDVKIKLRKKIFAK